MSLLDEGLKLIPIPNYKLKLKGERVWIINKSFPGAKDVIKAFEKGFKILDEQGTIQRAYRESGFINDRVKDWTEIK
jgi:hypothetical protein